MKKERPDKSIDAENHDVQEINGLRLKVSRELFSTGQRICEMAQHLDSLLSALASPLETVDLPQRSAHLTAIWAELEALQALLSAQVDAAVQEANPHVASWLGAEVAPGPGGEAEEPPSTPLPELAALPRSRPIDRGERGVEGAGEPQDLAEADTDEVGPSPGTPPPERRLADQVEAIEGATRRAQRAAATHLAELREILLRTEETPDRLDAVLQARLAELARIMPALDAHAQRLDDLVGRLAGDQPAEGTPAETLELLRHVFEPVLSVKSGVDKLNRHTEALSVAVVQLSQLAQQVIQDLPWLVKRVERALRKVEGEEPDPEDGGPVH